MRGRQRSRDGQNVEDEPQKGCREPRRDDPQAKRSHRNQLALELNALERQGAMLWDNIASRRKLDGNHIVELSACMLVTMRARICGCTPTSWTSS